MGIKDLGKIIPEESKGTIRYSSLKGKKVAIDISILLYKNKYGAFNNQYRRNNNYNDDIDEEEADSRCLMLCIDFAVNMLIYGILPIFVFDGQRRPEKLKTKEKRDKSMDSTRERIKILEEKIERKGESKERVEELYRLKSRKEVTEDDNFNIRSLLTYIGIPCLVATYDAEKLCTMLCLDGLVDAVYSNDTDALAMGCKLLLDSHASQNKGGEKIRYFTTIKYRKIIKGLDLNKKQFLHLCVMLGTDFNDRIPGVGVVSSMKYIKNNGRIRKSTIKTIPKSSEFLSKYKRTLEIFERESSSSCCQETVNIDLSTDFELLRERLSEYSLSHHTDRIVDAIEKYKKLTS